MKLTLIFLFICNACIGQYNNFYLSDTTTPSANIVMMSDSGKHIKISIYNDNGNICYYDSDDSSLNVRDSLLTIKWLIRLLIENIKMQSLHGITYPDDSKNWDWEPDTITLTSGTLFSLADSLPTWDSTLNRIDWGDVQDYWYLLPTIKDRRQPKIITNQKQRIKHKKKK